MTGRFRAPRTVRTLAWSAIAWTATALGACLIALGVGGSAGLGSAAVGAAAGILFPALTCVAAWIPDRWYGTNRYAAIAFFSFLAGFVVKVVVFLAAITVLFASLDVIPAAVYGALVATAIASLVVDVACANGIRTTRDSSQ